MRERKSPGRPIGGVRDTSNEIFRAGLQRFAAQGYDETTLRQIAEDANVDASLIVYQFGSKLNLWQAIIKRQSEDLHAQLARSGRSADLLNPAFVLRTAMESFVDFLVARPVVPQFLLRDLSGNDERTDWLMHALTVPLHKYFVDLAGVAVDAGIFAKDHCAFRIANFVYAAANSVARRNRMSKLVKNWCDDQAFRASLSAILIDPLFHHG